MPGPASAGEGQRAGAFAGATILLVQDELAERQRISWQLRENGFAVLEAASEEDALASLRRARRVDLLLADLMTSRVNGVALAARVVAERREVRVLFVTSRTPEEVKRVVGVPLAVLRKPFSTIMLCERVRAVLADS